MIGTPADHDYMTDYPRAHVIPVGNGQRSDAEAKRLVDFLLDNDIEVSRLRRDYRLGGQVFAEGSYVVRTSQALRALANTMLDVGDDISDRVTELYAPPGLVEQRLPVGRRRGDHRQGPSLLAGDHADHRARTRSRAGCAPATRTGTRSRSTPGPR